jgi:hypothetical protein
MLLCGSLAISAFAQNSDAAQQPRPMFVTLPAHLNADVRPGTSGPMPTWSGSFTYNGKTYKYNMVGTDPATGTSTTVPVYLVPIKIVMKRKGHKFWFDPAKLQVNGASATSNLVASPLFDATTTYTQGGTDVGTTQYEDAFQRANFWSIVQTNPNYHVLLGAPTVLPTVTLHPPKKFSKLGKPFGLRTSLVDINWFDAQLQKIMSSTPQIQPNTLPLFMIYDVYLTSNNQCCIGGYHSANVSGSAAQAYAVASYVSKPGDFSQDVSAFSHELGEFVDDPLVVNTNGNQVACGILEVGDPLENNANFGAYKYVLNGFTYNLQDLVTLPYFGAPPATSVNNQFTFQGEKLTVCKNGG